MSLASAGKMASRASDESLKWVDWPAYLMMVFKLREECGGALPSIVMIFDTYCCSTTHVSLAALAASAVLLAALDADGKPRADKAVAWSLQRYLIFAVRLSGSAWPHLDIAGCPQANRHAVAVQQLWSAIVSCIICQAAVCADPQLRAGPPAHPARAERGQDPRQGGRHVRCVSIQLQLPVQHIPQSDSIRIRAAQRTAACWQQHALITRIKYNLCKRRWLIKHGAADYKTGRSYGERPPLVLAHHLNSELEAWIATWRAKLGPQHDFLFTRRGRVYRDFSASPTPT